MVGSGCVELSLIKVGRGQQVSKSHLREAHCQDRKESDLFPSLQPLLTMSCWSFSESPFPTLFCPVLCLGRWTATDCILGSLSSWVIVFWFPVGFIHGREFTKWEEQVGRMFTFPTPTDHPHLWGVRAQVLVLALPLATFLSGSASAWAIAPSEFW